MTEPSKGGSNRTILLVEDDAVIRRMAQEYLTAIGYRVIGAESAEEAIGLAGSEPGPIDILVTDVTLPGASGPAVAEQLLKMKPGARILYISGYAQDAEVFRDAFPEKVDFLQKPFGLDFLARKIRASLDRSSG